METEPPILPYVRTESELPAVAEPVTDILPLRRTLSAILSLLPNLTKCLTERAEPREEKQTEERVSPNLVKPNTDTLLPTK